MGTKPEDSNNESTTAEDLFNDSDEARAERGDFVSDELEDKGALDKIADEGKADGEEKPAEPAAGKDGEKKDDDKAAEESDLPKTVPHSRFQEANERRKEAERRTAELEAEVQRLKNGGAPKTEEQAASEGAQATNHVDVKELRRQAKEAFLQGDLELASELEAKADDALLAMAEARTEQRLSAKQAQGAIEAAAAELVAAYPELDPETGDQEAIADVIAARDARIGRGMAPVEALKKAVELVAKANGWASGDKHGSGHSNNNEPDSVDERRKRAIKRAAEEGNGTPPPTGNLGESNRSSAVRPRDVAKMSEREFASLTEDDRARLRGDIV